MVPDRALLPIVLLDEQQLALRLEIAHDGEIARTHDRIVNVGEICRVRQAGKPFHSRVLLVAGNKNAVAAAVHAVNGKDGAAEDLLPVLGGLGKLHFKIGDTGVLRRARCCLKRYRALLRIVAFHSNCTAV